MSAIPVPYIGTGGQSQVVLGHYGVGQISGAIAATPTALDVHARLRWAPTVSSYFAILMRMKMGWGVISAVTAAVRMAYQLSIARAFSVDFTTACTQINMTTVAKTNQMRGSMSNSQMGASGPGVATTAPCTGQTYTLDAAPFAITSWVNQPSGNATVTQAIGVMGETKTMYEWTALGQHPVVLANAEGVVLQLCHTGWGSGTISIYPEWAWAEALLF